MKISKLDKRFSGSPYFKYYTDLPKHADVNFFNVRAWCWQTWGPSKSFYDWNNTHYYLQSDRYDVCQNSNWCWIDSDERYRILFKEREDVALFKLYYGG